MVRFSKNNILSVLFKQFKGVHRERKWLWNITTVLASVVVFVTTYALILPAITIDVDEASYCGYISHKHSDSCYDGNGNLICELPEHEHDMGCYTPALMLVSHDCGFMYEHIHDEDCYVDGVLVCTMQEHVHSVNNGCYILEYSHHIVYTTAEDGAVVMVDGLLPDNAYLKVSMPVLTQKEISERFDDYTIDLLKGRFVTYDISLYVGYEEYQPIQAVSVRVMNPAPELGMDDNSSIGVLHVSETTGVDDLACYAEESFISFTTESFSEFVFYEVAISGNENVWTFDGGTPSAPSEVDFTSIFSELHYTGHTVSQITSVTVTPADEELQIVNDEGVWKVRSTNAFYTRAQIVVTFSDSQTFNIIATGVAKREVMPDRIQPLDTSLSVISENQPIDSSIRPTSTGTSSVSYYSDSSTAKIEDDFYGDEDLGSKNEFDGKTVTDKSVVHGNNNYLDNSKSGDGVSDFTYSQDEFSVTLSALAQQFDNGSIMAERVPVDVVFILDVSGSMNSGATSSYDTVRRVQAVKALNKLINNVMDMHEGNRVSLVTFGSTSTTSNTYTEDYYRNKVQELLPLGRYYQASSRPTTLDYKEHNDGNFNYTYLTTSSETGDSGKQISVASNVYKYNYTDYKYDTTGWKSSPSTSNVTGSVNVSGGTFTQGGIQIGAEELTKNTDVTWTSPTTGKVYTRMPIIIMITDGAPTLCTSNYQNPNDYAHSDIAGFGSETTNDSVWLGTAGYYTILTANYWKRQVTNHYGIPSAFYTLGMGIYSGKETDHAKDESALGGSGDNYKRAVLKPSAENIQDLLLNVNSNNAHSHYAGVLYSLLHGETKLPNNAGTDFDGTQTKQTSGTHNGMINVGQNSTWKSSRERTYVTWMDIPAAYSSNLNYATDSYNQANWDPNIIASLLSQMIESNILAYNYTSSVKSSTSSSVTFTDQIGAGMEVKTGSGEGLYLRYGEHNYAMTYDSAKKAWFYTGDVMVKPNHYADEIPLAGNDSLGRIEATITTDSSGNQTVTWVIPSAFMPEYTHATVGAWYYEEYPIRLIYKVGLTDESKQNVRDLCDDSLTFYTNIVGENATATVSPNLQNSGHLNPYYTSSDYTETVKVKTKSGTCSSETTHVANVTSTESNSYETERTIHSSTDYTVKTVMGNNGKLVYTHMTKAPDPTKGQTSVKVVKEWKNSSGSVITSGTKPETSVTVRVLADGVPYVSAGEKTLDSSNNWSATFTNLPAKHSDNTDIVWTVEETKAGGSVSNLTYYTTTSTTESSWEQVTSFDEEGIYYFRTSSGSTRYSFNNGLTRVTSASVPSTQKPGDGSLDSCLWVATAVGNSGSTASLVTYNSYIATGSNRYIREYRIGGGSYGFQISTSSDYAPCTLDGSGTAKRLRFSYRSGGNNNYRYVGLGGATVSAESNQSYGTQFEIYKYNGYIKVTNQEKPKYSVTVDKSVLGATDSNRFIFTASYKVGDNLVNLGVFELADGKTKTFTNIPQGAQFTVSEGTHTGYEVQYVCGTDSSSEPLTVTVNSNKEIHVSNIAPIELPSTGGSGVDVYTFGGIGLLLFAVIPMLVLRRKL